MKTFVSREDTVDVSWSSTSQLFSPELQDWSILTADTVSEIEGLSLAVTVQLCSYLASRYQKSRERHNVPPLCDAMLLVPPSPAGYHFFHANERTTVFARLKDVQAYLMHLRRTFRRQASGGGGWKQELTFSPRRLLYPRRLCTTAPYVLVIYPLHSGTPM